MERQRQNPLPLILFHVTVSGSTKLTYAFAFVSFIEPVQSLVEGCFRLRDGNLKPNLRCSTGCRSRVELSDELSRVCAKARRHSLVLHSRLPEQTGTPMLSHCSACSFRFTNWLQSTVDRIPIVLSEIYQMQNCQTLPARDIPSCTAVYNDLPLALLLGIANLISWVQQQRLNISGELLCRNLF